MVVRSYEEAEERLKIWIESKEQLKSVDIESLHEVWGMYSDNRITGVFLGFGETWSTYFPFRQENFKYNLPIEFLHIPFLSISCLVYVNRIIVSQVSPLLRKSWLHSQIPNNQSYRV